jgi:DNA polymerase-4/protein ImuB
MRHADGGFSQSPVVIARSSESAASSGRTVLDCSHELTDLIPGIPLSEALSRYPDAVIVEADEQHYIDVFDAILDGLQEVVPIVENESLGVAYVGAWGLERLYGNDAQVVRLLAGAASGATTMDVRIGLGPNKWLARLAAMESAPHSARKVIGDPGRFAARFPIETLPVRIETIERLRSFGLETLGDIAAFPEGAVAAEFAPEGRLIWKLANGFDDRPVVSRRITEQISEYTEFPSPTVSQAIVVPAIESLLDRALNRLSASNRYVRKAELTSHVFQRAPWSMGVAFKEPVGTRDLALFAIKAKLDRTEIPGPLEDMRLTFSSLTGEPGQQESLWADVRRQARLAHYMGQLQARLGTEVPVFRLKELEPWSRLPERRYALVRLSS